MKTVRELAEEIVAREGGYVNDPDDPGGATKYGVTIDTMRRLGVDLRVANRYDGIAFLNIPAHQIQPRADRHCFFNTRQRF